MRSGKIKKDYKKKDFSNPYFNKKEEPKKFNTAKYLKIIFAVLLFYVIIYSDLFKIKDIHVYGIDMINAQEFYNLAEKEMNTWRWYLIPQNNLLLMSKSRLKHKIEEKYSLNSIIIDKGWRELTIMIEEKMSHLIIYNLKTDMFYFANQEGEIIREIPKIRIGEYWERFPILNVEEEKIIVGHKIITKKIIDFIISLNQKLKNTSLVNVQGYEKRGVSEISLVSKDGWRAYFDVNSDLDISVDNLLLILKEKIPDQSKIEYIDLRFGNKVFYK